MISTERLADVFVDVADTLVADFDLVEFLHKLTDHAASVSGASAVGLVLVDHRGTLNFMAASNDSGKALELFQLQTDEGPCLDCYRSHEPVVNADLAHAGDRWPQFSARATDLGFESVHAFPMRLRGVVIGALNLFGSKDVTFEPTEVQIVQAMADVATIAILQERAIAHSELLTEQLQGALNSRIIIEQAKGALAQREGISTDAAFELLRTRARSSHQRLIDVAAAVVDPDGPRD